MSTIKVTPFSDDLPYGARISGIDLDNVMDEGVREQIKDIFVDRGMIVFQELQPSDSMQVALSEIFGPLQDHALDDVPRADDEIPGLVEFEYADIFEVNGTELSSIRSQPRFATSSRTGTSSITRI